MVNKLVYLAMMISVWAIYFVMSCPVLSLFMNIKQACHLAMIVASVMTLLFVIAQRIFRGLHLINQIQDSH